MCVSASRTQLESNQHSVSGIWPHGSGWNQKTVSYTYQRSTSRFTCLLLRYVTVCFHQWYTCWIHSGCPDWRHSRTDGCSAAGHRSQVTRGRGGGQKVSPTSLHIYTNQSLIILWCCVCNCLTKSTTNDLHGVTQRSYSVSWSLSVVAGARGNLSGCVGTVCPAARWESLDWDA